MDLKKWNLIVGWILFCIALFVYGSTVEPTASFWDAGEYISTSAKLQVGHPPGAPLYQMMGAFFSTFAPNSDKIALCVNLLSVFSSAFTLLFMFWSLTYLLRKLSLINNFKNDTISELTIIGSATIGTLSFMFTDSFWFNAVEAEVYAMASLILSIMFYLGLRWEAEMDEPRGDRWLVLISFVIGLSFGVHFMGLLTIPAIGFLYFFKKYDTITPKKFVITNVIMVAVLMFIFKLLLPFTLTFFGQAEVFFVNSLGLPFNSGTIFVGLLLISTFYFVLKYTAKQNLKTLHTLCLCILFILIGFSSWLMLPIRANAGTVINENSPNNARELLAYYNREQYQATHLFYGPFFSEIYADLDSSTPYVDDKPKYEKDTVNHKYIIVNEYKNAKQNLDDKHKGLLPRMWSSAHALNYLKFIGPLDFEIRPEYANDPDLNRVVNKFRMSYERRELDLEEYEKFLVRFGQYINVDKPTLLDNIFFMIEYQFGYMYWRYFMWNFTGRQDDIAGKYTSTNGNWISGISFIDELRLGNQDSLTSDNLNNKARNTYFFIPLILGVIGLLFQMKVDLKNFWVLLLFFLFTGLALKVYLNERPFEPRERDYALVGSFYVFSMWIGFGCFAIFQNIQKYLNTKLASIITISLGLISPTLLASENWDDHDRSNRYTAQSMAKMYLDSCKENAILFTIGDNDTFALWYAQDIENYRTDVRTLNTSLFATDWYIDQMKKKAYKSEPIPSKLTHDFYKWGNNDAIFYQPITSDTLDIKQWMHWIESDDKRTQLELQSGAFTNTFPSKFVRIPIDKESVLRNNIVSPKDSDLILDEIIIEIKEEILYKNRLMMFDILANNNWERPIFFTGGSFADADYLWMKDYLQLTGVTYQLVPIKTKLDPNNPFDMGRINADELYEIVMSWDWGNSSSSEIYHDPETRNNAITYRSTLARLFDTLINEGKIEKATQIIDLGMEKLPFEYYGYYTLIEPFIEGYFKVEKPEKALEIWHKLDKKYQEQITYYASLEIEDQYHNVEAIITQIERYRSVIQLLEIHNQDNLLDEKSLEFNELIKLFPSFYDPKTESYKKKTMSMDKDSLVTNL